MEALMLALMTFAASFLNLPVPNELPKVVVTDRCEIQAFVRGVYDTECAEDDEHGVLAAYHHSSETIFIPRGFDPRELKDQAVLLHELAHHVQWTSGQVDFEHPEPCRAEVIEKPAYDLIYSYLSAAGQEDPYGVIGANGLFVMMVTRCIDPSYFGR